MEDIIVLEQPAQHARALEVREQLKTLTSQLEDSFFDTCDLLLEAHENQYHLDFGFTNFGDWIQTTDIGISPREARYYVNIASKALRLNVDRPTMKKVKISKLKEIFSLDPDKFRDEMEELLKLAPSMTLDQVKAAVRKLKLEEGQEEEFFMTIKGPLSAKPVIELALDMARKAGGFEDDTPNGSIIALICGDYTQGMQTQNSAEQEYNESKATVLDDGTVVDTSTGEIIQDMVEFNDDGSIKGLEDGYTSTV